MAYSQSTRTHVLLDGDLEMVELLHAMGCETAQDVISEAVSRGIKPSTFLAEVELRPVQIAIEG